MKKKKYQTIITILLLPLFLSSIAMADEWKLKKDSNGIMVFTRDMQGSKFIEFKATMVVESSMTTILKLMEDIKSYSQWFKTVKESRILKKTGTSEMVLYQLTDIPFPAYNRDSILKITAASDPKTGIVSLQLTSLWDYLPENKRIVRVKKVSGSWTFIPDREKGTVTIIYQMHSDPGGELPQVIVNSTVVKRSFNVLKNMREMLKKPQYNNASISELQFFK
jgi:hypothetical protein